MIFDSVVGHHINIEPFTEEDLYQLGSREEEPNLRRILKPFTQRSFAVTNVETQILLDKLRTLFDNSLDSDGHGVFRYVLADCTSVGSVNRLETMLSLGIEPDKPDADGQRATHVCGIAANVDVAKTVLLCRPDMKANNIFEETPLEATRRKFYEVRVPASDYGCEDHRLQMRICVKKCKSWGRGNILICIGLFRLEKKFWNQPRTCYR